MSFDIHFQRFEDGDAGTGGGDEARRVLGPYLQPSVTTPERIERDGSSAEIYGLEDGSMMVTHIQGDGLWGLLVDAAREAEWAIMPVGCPAIVFSQAMIDALPEGLDVDAVIISSGHELYETILAR
ncbi:MAG: hypothetical protein J0J05_14945 [Microbacterium sp.]|uniref:hypothetical protein n=1 Tax=Microbacterium sp. TaxID=51671 RepID=UPI001AC3C4F9|nr:hypothetical protein [Microbacterium sp.]MBN9155273.1 hypothetical protein [Microbacterium sp.]